MEFIEIITDLIQQIKLKHIDNKIDDIIDNYKQALFEVDIMYHLDNDNISFFWLGKKIDFDNKKDALLQGFNLFFNEISCNEFKVVNIQLQKDKKILFLNEYLKEQDEIIS